MNKVLAALILTVCLFGLAGCRVNCVGISEYYYSDAAKYTAGEATLTASVENIDIDWAVESVKIMSHNENTLSFSEKSETELDEDEKLRYWLDGTTLRIKFCASGKRHYSDIKKELTILVPDTSALSKLEVSTVSANANVSDIAVTRLVSFDTVSGTFNAELNEPLREFEGDTTSGSISVRAPSISTFEVDTVSGTVSLSAQKEPDSLSIDTTSGDVTLSLPDGASFSLEYDTTSGDLSSDLSYRKEAGKYVFGNGAGKYEIDTVSGDVNIRVEN